MSRSSNPNAAKALNKGDSKSKPYKIVVFGSGGVGKCWARNTKLMQANGEAILIQDVTESTILLGPDSESRLVNAGSLIAGRAPMFDVRPTNKHSSFHSYSVNSSHILVLLVDPNPQFSPSNSSISFISPHNSSPALRRRTIDSDSFDPSNLLFEPFICELSVAEFLSVPAEIQFRTRIFRPNGIQFPDAKQENSLISRIRRVKPAIASTQAAIVAIAVGSLIKLLDQNSVDFDSAISSVWSSMNSKFDFSAFHSLDEFTDFIRSNELNQPKFPTDFLTDSYEIRRQLLIGILFSSNPKCFVDSSIHAFQISIHSPILLDQLYFLSRSVGFNLFPLADRNTDSADSDSVSANNLYSLSIGSTDSIKNFLFDANNEIPQQFNSALSLSPAELFSSHNAAPFSIIPCGVGDYYGFTVSGPDSRVLMGDFSVSHNSSLTLRFHSGTFSSEYLPTIEDCYRKQCIVDKRPAFLDILDTAGQEEFSSLRDQWVREGQAFILIYSIASKSSLEELDQFRERILLVNEEHTAANQIPMILCGNKADLEAEREVSPAEGKALAEKYGNIPFIECSALNNENCESVFFTAVREIRRLESDAEKRKNPGSTTKSKSSWCNIL